MIIIIMIQYKFEKVTNKKRKERESEFDPKAYICKLSYNKTTKKKYLKL